MSTYVPKIISLPSGLDEIGLKRSLVRLPEEKLSVFKRRLLLDHRDGIDNSFKTFKKSPTRQVGQFEIPVVKLSSTLLRPRLKITSTKLYWWEDYSEATTLEIDLLDRTNGYFLIDVINALNSTVLNVEILSENLDYSLSQFLRIEDTLSIQTDFLQESYVTNLNKKTIHDVIFSDTLVFKTEKNNSNELESSGDYYIDYVNGLVFSFDLQRGSVTYTYSNFPTILWWQPVRTFELNDQDINYLIKDPLLTSAGLTHTVLNSRGTTYFNYILKKYSLEWGR